LPDYDRNEVEAKLNARLQEIDGTLGTVEVRDQYQGEELADYDQHPGDQGTETFEQEMDEAKRSILQDERSLVEQALQRLADGKYGICVDCGKEIPAERLKAMPEAIRCVEDQRRYEALNRETGGPVTDPLSGPDLVP
jgi:RNA polymerase-binding transcription factor DksA